MIGFALSQPWFTVPQFSLEPFADLFWVYNPEERYEKGIHEKHNGLLLDDAVGMAVVVMETDRFNGHRH